MEVKINQVAGKEKSLWGGIEWWWRGVKMKGTFQGKRKENQMEGRGKLGSRIMQNLLKAAWILESPAMLLDKGSVLQLWTSLLDAAFALNTRLDAEIVSRNQLMGQWILNDSDAAFSSGLPGRLPCAHRLDRATSHLVQAVQLLHSKFDVQWCRTDHSSQADRSQSPHRCHTHCISLLPSVPTGARIKF